jgi:hypothetical protein
MTYPLLAFDIDGTLVEHGKPIDPPMVRVIEELHALNWPMVIATARRRRSALTRLEKMGECFEDGIFNTGASTWKGESCVSAHILELKNLEKALALISEWDELDFYSLALEDEGLSFSRYFNDQELLEWGVERGDLCSFSDAVKRSPIRVCAWRAGANLDPLAERLRTHVSGMNWQVTDGGACLFGTSAGVGKGRALADYARGEGFAADDVIAFGDDFSDVDMFKWAGKSVAMASSPSKVKAEAEVVLDGGLSTWIEHHLLKS